MDSMRELYMPNTTPGGIMFLTVLVIVIIAAVAGIAFGVVKMVGPNLTPAQIRAISHDAATKAASETVGPVIDQLNSTDPFPNAKPENLKSYRDSMLIRDDMRPDRGGRNYIARFDEGLEGTPGAGMGRDFYTAAVDAGLKNTTLSWAITGHESGFFLKTAPGSNNGGGMTAGTVKRAAKLVGEPVPSWADRSVLGRGADGVRAYQWFPSKQAYAEWHPKYIVAVWGRYATAASMRGYAVSESWRKGVEGQQGRI